MHTPTDPPGTDAERARHRLRTARRRWRWGVATTSVLAILLIAVVVTAAIGPDDEQQARPDGTGTTAPPVVPSAASGPGTPLDDGFSVVDGTTLIGDPIPIGVAVISDGEPIVDQGWTATSIVDGGDPLGIVDAYLRQADEVGLAEQPGTGCTLDRDVAICSGFARSPDPAEPRSVSATVVRGRREDVVSDHVIVRFSTAEIYWEYGGGGFPGVRDLTVPDPVPWPPLPAPGEELGTAGEVIHRLEVQEGSRLAGPPHLDLEDATGGIVAVMEVTGDPRPVLDRYLADLTEGGLSDSVPEVRTIRGAVVTQAYGGGAGGDGFSFTMVERTGRPTWLRITGSHD